MEHTVVEYNCYGTSVDSETVEYKIEATVTVGGELPTTQIFVYTIGDEDNSATDDFARVGNAPDIQNLNEDRDAAIAAGDTEYLSSYSEFQYPDLDVAVQAKEMLSTRINELVNAWLTYQSAFYNDESSRAYPTALDNLEEGLRDTYVEAKDAREAAETTLTTAQGDLDDAKTDLDHANELKGCAQSCVDFLTRQSSSGTDIGFIPLLNTYHGLIVSEGSEAAALWSGGSGTVSTDIGARLAECQSNLQQYNNQVASATQEVNDAATAQAEAEQNLAAAEAAEDEALAAILDVCPDFDPSSV